MCECCDDDETERRVHTAEMDAYHEHFYAEWLHAYEEMTRLASLCKEVQWYSFETHARHWKDPWYATIEESYVHLFAARYERIHRRGRVRERGSYPVYYSGPISHAPPLPPQIMITEYNDACKYESTCRARVSAPYDWAPGGQLYEEHARKSLGARTLSDTQIQCDGSQCASKESAFSGRTGLTLGDPMERETETATKAATADLLAGIRAD